MTVRFVCMLTDLGCVVLVLGWRFGFLWFVLRRYDDVGFGLFWLLCLVIGCWWFIVVVFTSDSVGCFRVGNCSVGDLVVVGVIAC